MNEPPARSRANALLHTMTGHSEPSPPLSCPPADLRRRVLAAVEGEPSRTRRQQQVRNAALTLFGGVVPLVLFFWKGGLRQDPRPDVLVLETAGGAACAAFVAGVLAFSRGRSMLGRRRASLLVLTVAAPVALLLLKIGPSAQFPGMMASWAERRGFRCLWLGVLLAPAPLLAVLLSRRGTSPAHPTAAGAAMGAAVGACVWVLVDLWCPVAYIPHLFIGHVLPVVLTTVVGAFFGTRILDLPGLRRGNARESRG